MIHVEVLQPRTVTMGRRETMIHLQGGMNMVDEKKWELLEKLRKTEVERAENSNLIRVHRSKSGKITKCTIDNALARRARYRCKQEPLFKSEKFKI